MTGGNDKKPAGSLPAPDALAVVPLRHPMRLIAMLVVLMLLVMLAYTVIGNPELQWPTVARYMFSPLILDGLYTTLLLTIIVMVLAVVIGTIAALMMLSPSSVLSVPAVAFVWLFRGAPALVQLILWYNVSLIFPTVSLWLPFAGTVYSVRTNDLMTPFMAAVVALSLHEAGYMAEIVRAGLKTVSKGQTEAALSLGMHPRLLIRRVVLPQAMRMIIPPTGNETINLLKTTSLVSIIAVGDILYSAQAVYARTFETIPLLLVVAIWYLIVVSIMSGGQFFLERSFARDEVASKRSLLPRTIQNLLPSRRKVSPA
jgi:polar amino acid transport system permease protein